MKKLNSIFFDKLKDLLLYLSAFVPMYILIATRLIIDIINDNLTFNVLNTLNIILLSLLIILGIVGLIINIYHSKESSKEIIILKKQNITDRHFLGYFSLFVLFALQLELSYVCDFVLFILILILIGVVYIKNSLFYINPLLNILGYNFYDIYYLEVSSQEQKEAKIFYKGDLKVNQKYLVKFKNDNFSFIDKNKK